MSSWIINDYNLIHSGRFSTVIFCKHYGPYSPHLYSIQSSHIHGHVAHLLKCATSHKIPLMESKNETFLVIYSFYVCSGKVTYVYYTSLTDTVLFRIQDDESNRRINHLSVLSYASHIQLFTIGISIRFNLL